MSEGDHESSGDGRHAGSTGLAPRPAGGNLLPDRATASGAIFPAQRVRRAQRPFGAAPRPPANQPSESRLPLMLLSDFSIRRPVVATVGSLLLVVFGVFALIQRHAGARDAQRRRAHGIGARRLSAAPPPDIIETKVVKIARGPDPMAASKASRPFWRRPCDGSGTGLTNSSSCWSAILTMPPPTTSAASRSAAPSPGLPPDADPPVIFI